MKKFIALLNVESWTVLSFFTVFTELNQKLDSPPFCLNAGIRLRLFERDLSIPVLPLKNSRYLSLKSHFHSGMRLISSVTCSVSFVRMIISFTLSPNSPANSLSPSFSLEGIVSV